MEAVEPIVLVERNANAESIKQMIAHEGQARILMNLPCRGLSLLSHFQNAPQLMLDDIKRLNNYESQSEKLARKLRESPYFGFGLLAMTAVCTAGAYKFRRGALSVPTPQYLMQLRVAAQSACVGSVVAGAAYTMLTQGYHHDNNIV